MFNSTLLIIAFSFALGAVAAPAGGGRASPSSSALPEWQTVTPASDTPNSQTFPQDETSGTPEPDEGALGADFLGPQNIELDRQKPDFLAPPTTDQGSVGNAKWSFSLSHNRMQTGGWARQQNVALMPLATAMASVNMRLQAGSVRELHWHKTAEWGFILAGSLRVTAINSDGQSFEDTINAGDIWYFPAGIPHSLQATNTNPDGAELLLVFDDGNFNEDSTFSLTDWMAHIPKEVLAKIFQINVSAFDHIPSKELYIFPSAPPPPNEQAVSNPQGIVPNPFTFKLSQVLATKVARGTVKVIDSRTFKVATTIVGAVVTVEPGAMRELHWHPTQPEWSYFLEGTARMTVFASSSNAQTFDYQAGDIGYVPPSFGHYVENTGNTTMVFMEIFNTDIVEDISLNQWLALTPPELVKAHLGFDDATIAKLSKAKQTVI
ncbi:oxalate decarboxylase [Rickenella mellea]|uniref:Oxalate decarboxylase n=1 Tax=Rickenella mellea TaxID=50990 RepID=A0A4Y7QDT7_9AGAM|nr:oxalate decarboxylase [Rickenella mellea]